VTHVGGDAVPADELVIDGDVRASQRWGEYGSVSEGDSVTVDAAGSNRTIVVVHSGPYGDGGVAPERGIDGSERRVYYRIVESYRLLFYQYFSSGFVLK